MEYSEIRIRKGQDALYPSVSTGQVADLIIAGASGVWFADEDSLNEARQMPLPMMQRMAGQDYEIKI